MRIPYRFRASLKAFVGNGYDRGHLVASANSDHRHIENSETFLLSNMSPQEPDFNRKIWRKREKAVRKLNERDDVLETYVLTCPVFDFDKPITLIGDRDDRYGINVPVPHAFVKSVLTEGMNGKLKLWTFEIPNEEQPKPLKDFLVVTYDAEQRVGGRFWDRISGRDIHDEKVKKGKMWLSDNRRRLTS